MSEGSAGRVYQFKRHVLPLFGVALAAVGTYWTWEWALSSAGEWTFPLGPTIIVGVGLLLLDIDFTLSLLGLRGDRNG